MSMGISAVGWVAIAAVGGYVLASSQKPPEPPKPAEPLAPPQSQAAQMPDANNTTKSLTGMGQSGGAPGVAQTFLTGAGGVNQDSLMLGKTSLLGG